MCVQLTAHRLRDWRCSNMEVLYVFERGHKFQSNAEDILSAIAAEENARQQFRYRQHMFEEKDTDRRTRRICSRRAAFRRSPSLRITLSGFESLQPRFYVKSSVGCLSRGGRHR